MEFTELYDLQVMYTAVKGKIHLIEELLNKIGSMEKNTTQRLKLVFKT